MSSDSTCPECGAPAGACRAAFDRLLALEFAHPPAFAGAHHLTVACWSLQHPAGCVPDALALWRRLIADVLDGRATTAELLRRSRDRFEGPTRVRETGAEPPSWWPRRWPVRASDVAPPTDVPGSADEHVARVRRWARTVRATLDAADPAHLV